VRDRKINTRRFSRILRERSVNLKEKSLLISNFRNSIQKEDLTKPPNCKGYGRIHHFRRAANSQWPPDPLPIEPAREALKIGNPNILQAQVFQLSACNWRCWYCFVDYPLLSANPKHAGWLTTDDLVDLYLSESNPPKVIDLTGGQPDLVPEWVPWMMQSLIRAGLHESTYLWSDDNLSTDYLWQFLNDEELELMCNYQNYGKVGCFKGFDSVSFSFNTNASSELFNQQFVLMHRLLSLGLDLYGYATFTTPDTNRIQDKMARFVDRLQEIDIHLPLRTIPLEIKIYKSNYERAIQIAPEAIMNQYKAADAWMEELSKRFTSDELKMDIFNVPIGNRR
jgi:uncharacterized Fe-S cluster-containing radical SAM superfamily protein